MAEEFLEGQLGRPVAVQAVNARAGPKASNHTTSELALATQMPSDGRRPTGHDPEDLHWACAKMCKSALLGSG
ncbi:hypothetical protein M569_17746 [Genlisea aurea]|uniref:Uncharacterized protein n=1 Tax=Genlisea aurea TaxID=192259 RepID=S8BRP1_9LAMI|nr:hypothetical protein M569_17746 [Genlisea aurea]